MLAIDTLGATPTAILYIVAFVAFVLAAIAFKIGDGKANLLGVGLAAFVFPAAWNALAAT